MRVALVIFHADASRGGAERYTMDLARALVRAGHEVAMIATSFAETPRHVTQVELQSGGIMRGERYRRMLESLDEHLLTNRYDIVHAMLPVRQCDVYHPHAGIALAALDQPLIRFQYRRKAMATVERKLLTGRNSPVVLCLSDYVKRSVLRHYPAIQSRLATLFNSVDLDRFRSGARADHAGIHALFIGQDFERKGLPQTIAAMRAVNDPRLRLIVVGTDSAWSTTDTADIKFVGQTDDPCAFYRDADFFVLPTRHDPCSLVVLEALAMGVPVISTRFNGACEIMTDGVHGFVLDEPNDVTALAHAMRKMLDPQIRAQMSRACLELRSKLSYQKHLESLLATYQRVMDARAAHFGLESLP